MTGGADCAGKKITDTKPKGSQWRRESWLNICLVILNWYLDFEIDSNMLKVDQNYIAILLSSRADSNLN